MKSAGQSNPSGLAGGGLLSHSGWTCFSDSQKPTGVNPINFMPLNVLLLKASTISLSDFVFDFLFDFVFFNHETPEVQLLIVLCGDYV